MSSTPESTSEQMKIFDYLETETKSEEDVFEVEAIIGHKIEFGQVWYHIKWKGYDDTENTWETQDNITGEDVLASYLKKMNNDVHYRRPPKQDKRRIAKPKIIKAYMQTQNNIKFKVQFPNGTKDTITEQEAKMNYTKALIHFLESKTK